MAIVCPACGESRSDEADPCPSCGPTETRVELPVAAVEARVNPVGTVLDGITGDGDHKVEYNTPSGGRAVSAVNPEGRLRADLGGPLAVGKPNERRVWKTLKQKLTEQGVTIETLDAADDRGEDFKAVFDGSERVVQIVSVPADDRGLWASAKGAGTKMEAGIDRAVEMLRSGIIKKAKKAAMADLPSTILVLDASYLGALSTEKVVSEYRSRYGDPVSEFKFDSVWLVGPTVGRTVRL